MKSKKFQALIEIKENMIEYTQDGILDELEKFKVKHEGMTGLITIEIVNYDSVKYYQHKYYRGRLTDEIMFAWGEKDKTYIHNYLKNRFLRIDIDNIDEIKKKHLEKTIIVYEDSLLKTKTSGRTYIIIDNEKRIVGYIPSTALTTNDQMRKFIDDIEFFLLHNIGGEIRKESMTERSLARGE